MNQKEIFEQSYIELADPIFRYIYFRVFDKDIAKDLTQETFYKVWDYLVKGKEIDNVKAFTYRTAHNLLVNSIRNKKLSVSIEALKETIGFEVVDVQQAELFEQEQNFASVLESFKILDEEDADLLKLRYIDGLTIREISSICALSENNISVKIHRLLEKLKTYHSQT